MSRAVPAWALALLLMTVGAIEPPRAVAQGAAAVPRDAAALAGQHPAEYYRRAAALFEGGSKDDAVFIFYLGQLRYRAHLSARGGELKPDGDPALFASLSEVVGRPLNEYAFGDIPALVRTIDAVLAYDSGNPDTFTPPAQFPQAYSGVREGLTGLRNKIAAEADQIRATRLKNGLQNRN